MTTWQIKTSYFKEPYIETTHLLHRRKSQRTIAHKVETRKWNK